MSRNLQSQTKLTEFAPLSPEVENGSGFGYIFSKFFRRQNSPEEVKTSDSSEVSISSSDPQWQEPDYKDMSNSDSKTELAREFQLDVSEGRSLPNVLKRISNLLALKNTGRRSYNDTELKQYWMPDSVSKECYDCGERFTTFRRRHHCRVCGQIFCAKCCNQEIPGKIMNCTGDLRVCMYCGKVVLSYLESADIGAELCADLRALHDDLQTKFGSANLSPVTPTQGQGGPGGPGGVPSLPDREETASRRKHSVGYQEERFGFNRSESRSGLGSEGSSSSLLRLVEEAVASVQCSTARHRLRTYHACFQASHLVDYLLQHNKANTRSQGVVLGQAMLDSNYIESVDGNYEFLDGASLYRATPVDCLPEEDTKHDSSADSENEFMANEPNVPASNSIFNLNLNLEEKTVQVSKPPPTILENRNNMSGNRKRGNDTAVPENGIKSIVELYSEVDKSQLKAVVWHELEEDLLPDESSQKESFFALKSTFNEHCRGYLRQLLTRESVSQNWADIISPLAKSVVERIQPDFSRLDEMDIRNYVQVKKVCGGERKECEIINGVMCSKNVAHRAMPSHIANPRILLLNCAIVYQRIEGKFLSLEPVIMQEQDYIGHTVARIAALSPDLVLVSKNVSRLAQEAFLSLGISLALNVKQSVLERVSRLTGADILTSVDAHVTRPKLGTCRLFHLRTFTTEHGCKKTVMVLEGCPEPELGCTVLLRGASTHELAKIKRVTTCLIFAYFNTRLEFSYLMDARASPPNLNNDFRDTSPQSDSPQTIRVARRSANCEDKIRINSETVEDFSDPLHAYMNLEEDGGGVVTSPPLESCPSDLELTELPICNKFRKALEDNILSISPYLKFTLPYLESENGRKCPLRCYFGKKIYWSSQLSEESETKTRSYTTESIENKLHNVKLLEEHELVRAHLTEPADSIVVRALVANYRACGGRLPLPSFRQSKPSQPNSCQPTKSMDVLDPNNHQRLSVLFCSYSPFSSNAPTFCVDPWIVEMEVYGRNDIPLGAFLEKYCFRGDYVCPSGSCDVAMTRHTRRFVHDGGAVHVMLHQLETTLTEDSILISNYCQICNYVTPPVVMSKATWSFSFAKYLELNFHGDMYTVQNCSPNSDQERPPVSRCEHSLHRQFTHYFTFKNIVASFIYSKISVWEISLPPFQLETERECTTHSSILEEIKTWSLIGQQIFSNVLTKLCSLPPTDASVTTMKVQLQKDQANFKQRVEEVQAKLTASSESDKKEDLVRRMWKLEDMVVLLKRQVAEIVEDWNLRLSEADVTLSNRKKIEKKSSSELKVPQSSLGDVIVDGVTEVEISGDSPEPVFVSGAQPAEEADLTDHETTSDCNGKTAECETESEDVCEGNVASLDVKPHVSDKKSVKNILSQLLPNISTNIYIVSPMNPSEHHCLPLCYPVPVVVYEREPSSIIAYALSSQEYKHNFELLIKNQDTISHKSDRSLQVRSSSELLGGSPCSDPGSARTADLDESETRSADLESRRNRSNNHHQSPNIEVQFCDSSANFKVKVYFAEDFARLRELVLPDSEESFIRSLTRCVSWAATGGKSGSNFSKTKDDRFILKEMSRIETQIFIDFAPQYFTYMETCVKTRSPTLLGKILGVYRVMYRSGNTSCRSNLLVMEHLFHARPVTNKFDLKGSLSNRLVNTNTHTEAVLLDENLINMTCDSPLYILPHSKTILMQAIHNDTQFLATQSVMDYSLLVGLDHTNKELVVGIIDYIRTFTWDKKLETMVKRYGLLGQGKQPTIISPDEYRDRFITAMHRYFLPVPDRWTGLGKGVDC